MKTLNIYFLLTSLFLFGTNFDGFSQLNEGFEGTFPPIGWTVFDNGVQQNRSWQQATRNPLTGGNHAFVNFSSSTTEFAEDWLVTPQLLPDANNNTLTFQATNEYDGNTGSIYTVRVSNQSQTNPADFEVVTTLTETSLTPNAYQSFSVDLSLYIDQAIYVAFVLENSRGDSFLLDDVNGPPTAVIASVPNCDIQLTEPAPITWNNVPINTSLKWTPATGNPTGYQIQIGTSQGGDEFLTLTDIGTATQFESPVLYDYNTRYYITIVPYNNIGSAMDCRETEFTTELNPSITLDCGGTSTSVSASFCYSNNDNRSFLLSANNGSQVNLTFNSGSVENNQDALRIYDGIDNSGTLLNPDRLYGNGGDLTGITYISSTSNLFLELTSDATNSCRTGEQAEILFTASCSSCSLPVLSATEGLCDLNNNEFFIDLEVTDLGGSSITVIDDQLGEFRTISTTGITPIGPFSYGAVKLYIAPSNNQCVPFELPAVRVDGCPPINDECSNATVLNESADDTCGNSLTGTTNFATAIENDGICTSDALDVWYSFTPLTTADYKVNVSTVEGEIFYAVYEGTCGDVLLLSSDCLNEIETSLSFDASQTYLIQVFSLDNFIPITFDICVYPDEVCPPDYTGTNTLTGTVSAGTITDFETDGVLSSSQIIDVNTDYDSANCIELLPDFEVVLGAEFDAFIDGCNEGNGGNQLQNENVEQR